MGKAGMQEGKKGQLGRKRIVQLYMTHAGLKKMLLHSYFSAMLKRIIEFIPNRCE